MDCTEFLERYSDYDDSLVSPVEAERFRAHMAGCPSCTRYDRVLRKGRMLARQLDTPTDPDDFVPRLQRRLSRVHRPPRRSPGLAAALAAVTVLLVANAALTMLRVAGPDAASEPASARAGVVASTPAGWTVSIGGLQGVEPVAQRVIWADDGRALVLPAPLPSRPRAWGVERVDRRVVASYSPLVTGPPAYRAGAARAIPASTTTLRRTLD